MGNPPKELEVVVRPAVADVKRRVVVVVKPPMVEGGGAPPLQR